jgi:hypothetical protein
VNDILDVNGYKLSDSLLATEVEYEKVFKKPVVIIPIFYFMDWVNVRS